MATAEDEALLASFDNDANTNATDTPAATTSPDDIAVDFGEDEDEDEEDDAEDASVTGDDAAAHPTDDGADTTAVAGTDASADDDDGSANVVGDDADAADANNAENSDQADGEDDGGIKSVSRQKGEFKFNIILDTDVVEEPPANEQEEEGGADEDQEAAAEDEDEDDGREVQFRIIIDDDPEEVAAVQQETSLKDMVSNFTLETLPSDAPKWLRILITQKEAHMKNVEKEMEKVRARAEKFGMPEPVEALARLQKQILEFDLRRIPEMQLSLRECRRLLKAYITKLQKQQDGAAKTNGEGDADENADEATATEAGEAQSAPEDAAAIATVSAQQAEEARLKDLAKGRERLERFGFQQGYYRKLATTFLPKAPFTKGEQPR